MFFSYSQHYYNMMKYILSKTFKSNAFFLHFNRWKDAIREALYYFPWDFHIREYGPDPKLIKVSGALQEFSNVCMMLF